MKNTGEIRKLGLIQSFSIYLSATLLMYLLTKYLIPYLHIITGQETILFWFIVAGIGIFTPLIYIQSFIVQKTKNSWTGVILHAGLNGPSFIAICFGII